MSKTSHRGGCQFGLWAIAALFLLLFVAYQIGKNAG